MRIVMMGTGAFAVPTFESLIDSQDEVIVLVTRPMPEVRTRGQAPRNPMHEVADARGVHTLTPLDVNSAEARERLSSCRPELFVVCDFGQILSAETLALAPLGGINLHGSLLPKYRGAAPVQWAILRGDVETGVTVIHMTPKLDAGPILSLRKTPVDPGETAEQLEGRLSHLGVEPVREAIQLLAHWDRVSQLGVAQDPSRASRAPRLKKSDGQVDWHHTAAQICNQVRALKPWPKTFTLLRRPEGEPLRLILDEVSVAPELHVPAVPGEVIVSDTGRLLVATSQGVLAIHKVQPAGKRLMRIAEFLRGHLVLPGTRLG